MSNRIRIRASADPFRVSNRIDLLIAEERPQGMAVVSRIEMTELEPGYLQQPSLRLDPDAAQELMDELWRCGIRPTEGQGSAGQMEATRTHLEDMRRLVFSGQLEKGSERG